MVVPTPAARSTNCAGRRSLGRCRSRLHHRRRPGRCRPGLWHRKRTAVDKIVGPGNIYVATAKRHVFGKVGIDMIAARRRSWWSATARPIPDWNAMDLFSQAEHDETPRPSWSVPTPPSSTPWRKASPVCCGDGARRDHPRLPGRPRRPDPVTDMAQAIEVANRIAPEHLELSVAEPEQWLPASATPAPSSWVATNRRGPGRLLRGPNHVLPTSGTARFSSPLACTTSRSVPRSSTARLRALPRWAGSPRCWRVASP